MEDMNPAAALDEPSLRSLLDEMPVGVGLAEPVEPDGTIRPEARIVYYNREWVRMFGFDVGDVRTVREATARLYPDPALLEERLKSRREAAARRLATGVVEPTEARAMGAGGRWLHVITGTNVVGGRLMVTMLDITARKDAERAMEAALAGEREARAAAERAHRAKTLFLANVSHEIRTPLAALVSLAQAMALEGGKHRLPPDFVRFLSHVRSGGSYLNLLLSNLLDVSATESGHAPIRPSAFYLHDWTDDLGHILGPVASSRDVVLEWVLPPDADLRLHTDPLRLSQVVLNLAHNAIKFTAGHGRRVTVSVSTGAAAVEVLVDDEGPGIPPGRIPSLFRAFEQGGVPEAPGDRGVGLGLAVARQNAALLGGSIDARNLPGRGMRFIARFPASILAS